MGATVALMREADRHRLVTLLALTTSPQDGEALTAARKANEMLNRLHLTWTEVIPPGGDSPSPRPHPQPSGPWTGDSGQATNVSASKVEEGRAESARGHGFGKQHPGGFGVSARPTFFQRLARLCLGVGVGVGILAGVAGFASMPEDPRITAPALVIALVFFAAPAMSGCILWLLFRALPSRRLR